jgi:hypothetical protein
MAPSWRGKRIKVKYNMAVAILPEPLSLLSRELTPAQKCLLRGAGRYTQLAERFFMKDDHNAN